MCSELWPSQAFGNALSSDEGHAGSVNAKLVDRYAMLCSYANSPANGTFAAGMASPPSVSSGSGIHKAAGPPTPDSSAGREERIKVICPLAAPE